MPTEEEVEKERSGASSASEETGGDTGLMTAEEAEKKAEELDNRFAPSSTAGAPDATRRTPDASQEVLVPSDMDIAGPDEGFGSDLAPTGGQSPAAADGTFMLPPPVDFDRGIAAGRIPASLMVYGIPTPGLMPVVMFDFNPEKIQLSRTAHIESVANLAAPDGAIDSVIATPGLSITISNLTFVGMLTKLKCDTLLDWCTPRGDIMMGTLSAFAQGKMAVANMEMYSKWNKPKTLMFTWGPPFVAFSYTVKMTSVTVNYERFTKEGIPIQANVTLNMKEEPSLWGVLPTNPTSGGLPGRREHLVTQGENLQGIALKYYGRPSAWRPIAKMNGINDPLRIRPGQRVLIPNPEDLSSEEGMT